MPNITVELLRGRSLDQRREFVAAVTEQAIAILGARQQDVRIVFTEIDAVDVSAEHLARARTAVYGSNSFRGPDLMFRDRYFSRSSAGYLLTEELSAKVRFHHGNLSMRSFSLGVS